MEVAENRPLRSDMKSIATAESLRSAGRFREALEALPPPPVDGLKESAGVRLLRAELLVEIGITTGVPKTIEMIEGTRGVTDSDRSQIEFIKSRICKESGDLDSEFHHLQRSISFAEKAHDIERLCCAQLSLVALVADRSGPETVTALLNSARSNVIKLGSPSCLAALHLIAGEVDGKRSLLATAGRHIELARKLLLSGPHLWFDAWSQIDEVAISILKGDFDDALSRGATALSSSLECGVQRGIRSSLGNLGHVHLMRGEFDRALAYFSQNVEQSAATNEQGLSSSESIAQIHLALGAFEESLKCLDREWNASGVGRYAHRHGLLTRAQVLFRLDRWSEAL